MVVDFLEQYFVALDRLLEVTLITFALDCHAENVGGALQEREIVLDKIIVGTTVDLQHSERLSVTLQDDVHRSPNPVGRQYVGSSESLLALEMVGYNRLPRAQRKAGRELEVGTDTGDADNARFPAHARTHKKTVFSGGSTL